MKKILSILALGLMSYLPMTCATAMPTKALTVPEFIDKMVKVDHYDRQELLRLFEQTEYLPEVIDRINKPFEEKPWDFYKSFFITQDRIDGGVQYWHAHAATLEKVSQQYGVSPAVIVAIIGIETKYGQETGQFSELRTLSTLAFHYPKRSAFFQSELENYLLLTREYQLPPLSLNGSYAGAMGIPQFMPSNYRVYAVSYDGKSSVNLLEDHDDAIASIANYLKKAGWKANEPVAVPAKIEGQVRQWIVSADAKPVYRLATLSRFGVQSSLPTSPSRKAALVEMHNTHDNEYWVTFQNFHSIMAYNPRTTYAMAIYQLSQAIQGKYEKSQAITAAR